MIAAVALAAVMTFTPAVSVDSTAYCGRQSMKSGRQAYDGAVAVPRSAWKTLHGTRWQILDGPLAGKIVTVEDQIGHGSEFDVWRPSCGEARGYGRHQIHVRRLWSSAKEQAE